MPKLDQPYTDEKKGKEVAEIVDKILTLDEEQLEDLLCTLRKEGILKR